MMRSFPGQSSPWCIRAQLRRGLTHGITAAAALPLTQPPGGSIPGRQALHRANGTAPIPPREFQIDPR
jgi:hypothetical protein